MSPRTEGDDPDAWMDKFAWAVGLTLFAILVLLMVMLALN